jgi:hypothetical protein
MYAKQIVEEKGKDFVNLPEKEGLSALGAVGMEKVMKWIKIDLTRLATQFIEYIETMRLLDLEIAGEFLVMAATLMYIKSRELLPVDMQAQPEGEEDGEDPRWELIRQLVEYKKFKDAALQLGQREEDQSNIFARRGDVGIEVDARKVPLAEVSIFDLINAFNDVLKKATARDDFHEIGADVINISQPNVVDVANVGCRLRGRQCFLLPISYQTVSIQGTPKEIHAEARRLYDCLGAPTGGFIGYVEEYGVMGMSRENYRACSEASTWLSRCSLSLS